MDAPKSSTKYRARVAQYLASPLGAGTSDRSMRRLLAILPSQLGIEGVPSFAQIHTIRSHFDAWDYEEQLEARAAAEA